MQLETFPGGLRTAVLVEGSVEALFSLISDPRNLDRVTPPWFRLTSARPFPAPDDVGVGTQFHYRLRLGPLTRWWTSEIDTWDPPNRFAYVQRRGPYRTFRHDHRIEALPEGCRIMDEVDYTLWSGPLGHRSVVLPLLRSIFEYRATALQRTQSRLT